jgi:tripartite-type tricarboxylate transporter receptor subunit TctC
MVVSHAAMPREVHETTITFAAHHSQENRSMPSLSRAIVALIPACLGVALVAAPAWAQTFPVPGKPLRIVVPFPPGGQTDVIARLIAPRLTEALGGTPVVVDNKAGANTMLGAQEVARAAPDGHTLLFTNPAAHTQLPHLVSKIAYDAVKDFTPVAQFVSTTVVLVGNPSVPATNLSQLLGFARANPGKLNYASFAAGSSSHLYAEILKQQANVDIQHIPYKGTADAMRDLLGGQVQLMFDGIATATVNIRAGKVRPFGIAGRERSQALPEVPTFNEQGISGIDVSSFIGFFAPGNQPREITARLNQELVKVLRIPEVAEVIRRGGNEPVVGSAEDFAREVQNQYETWGRVIKRIGLKLD